MENQNLHLAIRKPAIFRFQRKRLAPTVTIDMNVVIEPALNFLDELNQRPEARECPVTLQHLILKAVALALQEQPFFHFGYNGRSRVLPIAPIDLSIPLEDSPAPMEVVLSQADRLDLFALAGQFESGLVAAREQASRLAERLVREWNNPVGRILERFGVWLAFFLQRWIPFWENAAIRRWCRRHGSFVVQDLRAYGVSAYHGHLARPAIASLVVLAFQDEVVVENGEPRLRKLMPVVMQFDHRMADASFAARFLALVKKRLEDPKGLLDEPA